MHATRFSKALVILIGCLLLLLPAAHVQAGAKKHQIINFSMYGSALGSTDTGTLDPMRTYQLLYYNLQHQIFETLVSINFDTQSITPVLAESWKQTGEKTVRFFLRHGVRYHNGENFTSRAVKFSIELMQNPRNKFAGRFLLDSIAEVRIIDDYTVDITMRNYDSLLLRKLATIGFMFPPKYYRKVGDSYFTRYPIGTGPFRFFYAEKDNDTIQKLHLVANEDYWRAGIPSFKELVYNHLPCEKQWEALASDRLDLLITEYSGCSIPEGTCSLKISSHPTLKNSVCLLNIDKKGPLADIRVRKALQQAVDRTQLIKKAMSGYAVPLFGVLPAGSLAYKDTPPLYHYSPARARALLKKAGYENGCTLSVMASDNNPNIRVVRTLKQQLQKAGITLRVSFLSRDAIIREVIEPKLRGTHEPSRYDMWVLTGWPHIFGTGSHFYFVFLHSQGMCNFGVNLADNSPIDRIYGETVSAKNKSTFIAKLRELDRYIMEQALVVPLYQPKVIYGMNKKIDFKTGLSDIPLRLWQCSVKP